MTVGQRPKPTGRSNPVEPNFGHREWREPVLFMLHCSTKWATYLVSLKQLIEEGAGAPSPRDLKIIDREVEAAAS